MRRALPTSLAIAALALAAASVFAVSPAHAASSITLDDLDEPGVVYASPGSHYVEFAGDVTRESTGAIVVFVDGTLLTCEDYFGNDINAVPSCIRVATVEGTRWTFGITGEELDRLGIERLGEHDFRFVLAEDRGDRVITAEIELTATVIERPVVLPSAAPGVPAEEPAIAPPTAEPTTASQLGDGGTTAPSVLSALPTVAATMQSPPNLLVAAVVTIVLLLIVGLPSSLLGSTLSDNYDRLFGPMTAAMRSVTKPVTGALTTAVLPRWLPLAIGLSAATLLSCFVDPEFGLNWGSARLLLSLAIAFAVETLLGWAVIRAVLKRTDPDLDPKPEFKWGSLLIILVAVVLSRLVGFEPGMVFGLIVGLAFGVTLAAAQDVRVKLIGLGWALAIGLLGWVVYSLLAGVDGWLPLLLAETFSGVAVASLAALPVALLPLRGLDGETLFRWNRWVWAGLYTLALLLFFTVLMPMPFSWGEVGAPLVTWVILYLGYAALAVGVWAWFRFRAPLTPAPLGAVAAGS